MSTIFTLSGARFDRKSWEAQLSKLLSSETSWIPHKCMDRLYPSAADQPFKSDAILLLGKGSSRGISLESKGKGLTLELMSFASEQDWEIARYLLEAAHKLGAEVTSDEGLSLSPADLESTTFRTRGQEARTAELAVTQDSVSGDGEERVRLPVADFELSIQTADLSSLSLEQLMESFVQQCNLYGNAHVAKAIVSEAPDGTRFKHAHYSGTSTLIPADVEGMTFSGPDGYYANDAISMDRVREILAEFITPVGNYLHFPPIHWDKRPALLEALTSRSMKQILESLDRQLADSLVRLPVLAFVITARCDDGNVNHKEGKALLDYVNALAAKPDDETVFANACRRLQHEMKQVIAGIKKLSHPEEFQLGVRQLDHRFEPETASAYKIRLYELAEHVAKTSARSFLGFGGRINGEKQEALAWIKSTLFPQQQKQAA